MRISQLDGKRVALWGWGREGRAAHRALRMRLPNLPLTLFCSVDEAGDAAALQDALLATRTHVDADALSEFDVVVKSPGISPYRDDARTAISRGTRFIGGTALWFAEQAAQGVGRTLCVTGTKGKSTTTALLEYQDHKPFECVGEGRESRAAMAALAERPEWREDALVERFAREIRPQLDAHDLDVAPLLVPDDEHNLPPALWDLLRAHLAA